MKRTRSGNAKLVSTKSEANSAVTLYSLDNSTVPPTSNTSDVSNHETVSPDERISPRRSKRRRVVVEQVQSAGDVPVIRTEHVVSKSGVFKPARAATPKPRSKTSSPKKVRAQSSSPKKPKAVPRSLETPHPAPEHWQEVYEAIKLMRAGRTAAVDTMGCEQSQSAETDPKVVFPVYITRLRTHILRRTNV